MLQVGLDHALPNRLLDHFSNTDINEENRVTTMSPTGEPFLKESEYKKWIGSVLAPSGSAAFMVIDMQNDFLTGSLALRAAPASQDGLEVLRPLNSFLKKAKDNFGVIG